MVILCLTLYFLNLYLIMCLSIKTIYQHLLLISFFLHKYNYENIETILNEKFKL